MKKKVYIVWYTYASARVMEGVFSAEMDAERFISMQSPEVRCLYAIEAHRLISYR